MKTWLFRNKNSVVKGFFLIFLFFLLIYFFRGAYQYGMNMDEVTRPNNLVAMINPDAYPQNQGLYEVSVFGYKIPIMQREYISMAMLLPYLPIFLFDDYMVGIRTLYFIYFFLALSVYFLIASKFDLKIASISTILIATNPIFYPEITIGFAWPWHLLIMTPGIYLLYLYFKKATFLHTGNLWLLFFGFFLVALTVNISFYNFWILAALTIVSVVFFYKQLLMILTSWYKLLVVLSGFMLGMLNFVIYNIDNKMATFLPLYQKIFDLEEYNKNPLNYTPSQPLFEDVLNKVNVFWQGIVVYNIDLYLYLFLLLMVAYLYLLYRNIIGKKLFESKYLFLPIMVVLLLLFFLAITPNANRAGHFVHLSPFISLAIAIPAFYASKYSKIIARLFGIILLLFLVLNFQTTNLTMTRANETNGIEYFSPAIFEMNDYFIENNISDKQTIYLQWGMYSQIYFLQKGEYKINSQVFQLVNKDQKVKKELLKNYLVNYPFETESLYFPIYDVKEELWTLNAEAFFELMRDYKQNINLEKQFYEKNGQKVFALYRLDNFEELKNILIEEIKNNEIN